MFKKYFYLVRHGETILNAEHKRQGSEGGLSVNGQEQVMGVAKILKDIEIQKIFCSPFERTRETLEIINKSLNLAEDKIIFTPLLAERKNPTEIIGKGYDDPIVEKFIDTMDKSIHDADLRLTNEENFTDLRNRALETQKYLINEGENKNLCVTHGIFLKMFLATLLYGQNLSSEDYVKIEEYNSAHNAALTLISYDSLKNFFNKILFRNPYTNPEYNPWKILAYNYSTN